MLKRWMSIAAAMLMTLSIQAADYQEGEHFKTLPEQVRTRDASKIEVVELFWYGCIHCFHFDPMLKEWEERLPADVDFHRSPAMWNKPMAIHAQAFFAAEALGVLDQMHDPLFAAMNVERKRLADEDELAEFFAQHGVDEVEFRKAFNSFGVQSKVRQADAKARSYRITGTPSLVVDGKYLVTAKGGLEEIIKVADFLVAKERTARGS